MGGRSSKEARGLEGIHQNGRAMLATTEEGRRWTEWCGDVGMRDVFWSWEHLALLAGEWDARPLGVRWSEGGETILHPVLLVPLDRLSGGAGRFDVRTAYDFGGPRHVGADAAGAMAKFEAEWSRWTEANGVVTEFLRLHPTALAERPTWASFHAEHHIVDLSRPYDEIRAGYTSSWRARLRQGESKGAAVEVTGTPDAETVRSFLDTYRQTMAKVDAAPEFRFREETLRGLLGLPDVWLATVRSADRRCVAHAVVLASGPTLFYHLGCSDQAHLDLRPNQLLFDALVGFGREQGLVALHLGGGSPSLRRFKAGMGGDTVPYHLVRRVVDDDTYAALCAANGGDAGGGVFPAYIGRFEG